MFTPSPFHPFPAPPPFHPSSPHLSRAGVILTLPEYRCSLQLKLYESVKKDQLTEADHFLRLHNWIQANVRNILDESDAILQPKYQLIYTVGNQMQIDGGEHRWLVAQAILKRVPHHMRRLHASHGDDKIEFDGRPTAARADVFTPCRLLEPAMFAELRTALIDDFIAGCINFPFPEMSEATKKGMRHILSQKQINRDTFELLLSKFSGIERNSVMIMSGLLRFDVLRLMLTKRWRVHYGVDAKGARKMAVPFKAKDVAAEMTEFGHADVAIGFTLLSYYYSGEWRCGRDLGGFFGGTVVGAMGNS